LDGNADGTPGGVFNFWFQTRPLERVIELTGDSTSYVDGQTLTIEDAHGKVRRFEFDNNNQLLNPGAIRIDFSDGPSAAMMATRLANAINQAGFTGVAFSWMATRSGYRASGWRFSAAMPAGSSWRARRFSWTGFPG
jgi:hypothetical protein